MYTYLHESSLIELLDTVHKMSNYVVISYAVDCVH
jgi:hypothetical protein